MTIRPLVPIRRALIAASCAAIALVAVLATAGSSAQAVVGPDVTVFSFTDIASYGSANGFAAYSVGTRSCNRGTAPVSWCSFFDSSRCVAGSAETDHPVIAQNLYRLKDGRFSQIGMSWLKHGFASLNAATAGCAGAAGQSCQPPPGDDSQLGVGCTDPYTASTNGTRPLGRRSEVDATTGVFPDPMSPDGPYAIYDQRIKVAVADVDPALNAGALYWLEGQYVAKDDAGAGNALNNASHGQVTVGAGPTYALTQTGTFVEGKPAIFGWKLQDSSVELVDVDVPGGIVERFEVARKVNEIHGGLWHYEYAVHNLNSDRSARSLAVRFPEAATFTNVGFRAIDHHSGEPYATDDWTPSSTSTALSWSTSTYAADPNANALRFATMFNFWFDADRPPAGVLHTLGLFKPGTPASIDFAVGTELFRDGFESGDTSGWQ
jgi:hypothetical protein